MVREASPGKPLYLGSALGSEGLAGGFFVASLCLPVELEAIAEQEQECWELRQAAARGVRREVVLEHFAMAQSMNDNNDLALPLGYVIAGAAGAPGSYATLEWNMLDGSFESASHNDRNAL